ncbi:MAG: hypothetical protein O9264_08055 [Leptospira sp.]|nr:hypothetical protein [Leptospira sp.]
MNRITKKEILAMPVFKFAFRKKLYLSFLNHFLVQVNKGALVDHKTSLGLLIKEYCRYCGVSLGYRSVIHAFAWELLNESPELWNEEERQDNMTFLDSHMREFYPEYDHDQFDVGQLSTPQFLEFGFSMVEEELKGDTLSVFAFAMYISMKRWTEIEDFPMIDMEEFKDHFGVR